jgi:hypothetical protein
MKKSGLASGLRAKERTGAANSLFFTNFAALHI